MIRVHCAIAVGVLLLSPPRAVAQDVAPASSGDTRTQYPAFLVNSYFAVTFGYIDYTFSQRQMEPGFQAASITVPHAAARVAVFGHEFSPRLAAQLTYMRPVQYVTYRDVNGDGAPHHVWVHFGGVTMKARVPIAERTFLYGEGGLGITSRHGFPRGSPQPVVRDAHDASFLLGAGVEHRVSDTWDLTAGAVYSPAGGDDAEPRALMFSGGFRYTMRALPPEEAEANRAAGFFFPAHLAQLEYSTGYGYAVNTFLSEKVPVFWGGTVKSDRGLAVHYDHNVFHTRKVFALDLGVSASSWRSQSEHIGFATLSAYPLFRFMLLRARLADAYVCYSLAGPTYISRIVIDGLDTGRHFTFQDFIGAGAFLGRRRHLAIGVKINHYSNGNIFTENAGVKIPATIAVGYAF